MSGYQHPNYVRSLAEFGEPYLLSHCGGHLLMRQIPGSVRLDVMGCYPLFACEDWSQLNKDLANLSNELTCLTLVTDPFGNFQVEQLRACFPDRMFHYKDHFVLDFTIDNPANLSHHHQRNVDKALRGVSIEYCDPASAFLEDWIRLYDTLIQRHQIQGIATFSRRSFEILLNIPGLVAFRAMHREEVVGMVIFLTQGKFAYYHLGAYSDIGYELRASFALFHVALPYFRAKGFSGLTFGAGAGTEANQQDGLSRFKRGWANSSRPVYFCGRIINHTHYAELLNTRTIPPTDYFPAYRLGEF